MIAEATEKCDVVLAAGLSDAKALCTHSQSPDIRVSTDA
jgi:hypothetical protein